MKVFNFYFLMLVIGILFLSGCSSTSLVRTNPPGGKVYQVDTDTGKEVYLGVAPVQIEGRAFKSYYLRAERDSYQGTMLIRAREVDAGRAAVGCLACGVPGLLGAGMVLPDQITIHMYEEDVSTREQVLEIETNDGSHGPKKLQ